MKVILAIFCLATACQSKALLDPKLLESFMYTQEIDGKRDIMDPSKVTRNIDNIFPVESYEIVMMNTKQQFLPPTYPATPIYAYATKQNGKFIPSYPGPTILGFKGSPIEITWTNEITGKHFLPLDLSPPFDMIAKFSN